MSHNENGFDEWGGYMQAKITKLEEQFATASSPFRQSNLFNGISIYVNGLTNPSADELKRIMMVHGGTFHHYERSHTTFVIASNLPDVKVRNMDTSRIVSPQWVVDCVRENRILDYTRYLLYTNQKTTQPKISFAKATKQPLQTKAIELATIVHDLDKLNAQLRESLAGNKIPTTVNPNVAGNLKRETKISESVSRKVESNHNDLESQKQCEHKLRVVDAVVHELDEKIQLVEDVKQHMKQTLPNTANDGTFAQQSEQKADHIPTSSAPPPQQFINISKPTVVATKNLARTATDEKFLTEFFNNSRLHHIATLGTGFKQYIADLREEHGDGGFPLRSMLRDKLLGAGVPSVDADKSDNHKDLFMHIDLDCFFVSVGLRTHPHLRGQPIAVTHSKGGTSATNVPVHPDSDRRNERKLFIKRLERQLHANVNATDKVRGGFDEKLSLSEIASCSYEARAKGVRNGMFVGHAMQLCPELKTIPYDFEGYKEVAYSLYNIIAQYTLEIEAVSCDEMYVNLSDILKEVPVPPMELVRVLRDEVREKTGCPCSAGVGANKLQARMATKRAKPDGQYNLLTNNVAEYMNEIPIKELPGVGNSNAYTLRQANLLTCGDLQKLSLAQIQAHTGKKLGETLHQFCRGIDTRPLQLAKPRQSVSAEVNYGIRFSDNDAVEKFLRQLSAEVHQRLLEAKRTAKCITLKIMTRAKDAPIETSKFMGHGFCDNVSKSVSLSEYTNDQELITRTVLTIMKSMALPPNELRGIGIQLNKLNDPNEEKSKSNILKNMFSKIIEKQKDKPTATVNEVKHKSPSKSKEEVNSNNTLTVLKTSPTKRPAKVTQKRSNVLGMLKDAAAKRPRLSDEHCADLSVAPEGVDPKVFAELPASIRDEIIQSHARFKLQGTGRNDQSACEASTSKAATNRRNSNGNGNKPTVHSECDGKLAQADVENTRVEECPTLRPLELKENISAENIFDKMNATELLLAWVRSTDAPEQYDIELIATHAVEMIRAKAIVRLLTPLIYLAKLINQHSDCHWHAAFKAVVHCIQTEMREQYDGRTLLNEPIRIKCTKCT